MSASTADLRAFLDGEGIRYIEDEGFLRASFSTDRYRDRMGTRAIFIALRLEEDGEYFKLIAPNLYWCPPGPRREAVLRALMGISWRTKLVQFEYDDEDGEVRAIVEFPLEDSPLSARQLSRCLNGLVQIIDEYHPVVARALSDGIVDFTHVAARLELERQAAELFSEFGALRTRARRDRGRLSLEE